MRALLAAWIAAIWISGPAAFADPIQNLYNGPREMGMGGASTAITEGSEAVFLNPAAMAANRGMSFSLLDEQIEVSGDTITEYHQSSSAFKNISFDTLQQLVGKDIYGRSQFTPTLLIPNFGMAILVDDQFELRSQNLSLPQVTFGLQETNGIQFATGFEVMGGRKHSVDDLRVGAGFKMLWRRGGYHQLTLDQIVNIDESEIKQITGSYGLGESADLGVQYIHKLSNNRIQLMAGADYQNIGGLSFSGGGDMQPENLSMGAGAKFITSHESAVLVDYDIKNMTNGYAFSRMNHFGAELQIPTLELDLGLNESHYFTGGITVDLWLLKVTALTYEEELAEYAGQEGERVYALHFTFVLGI